MRCSSGHENRAGAAFCIDCGAKLPRACDACGRELPPAARFCDGCGAPQDKGTPQARAAGTTSHADQRYVPPPHLAAKILRERGAIEGERRTVTVLFIDAVGSTAAGERLDAEELHGIVHACTDLMIEAVNRYEGTVTQFRGDGIMALFGAPIAHEDSARRGVSAAIAMRDSLMAHAAELVTNDKHAFQFRIGLHTGPVIVGTIGNDFSMDYTAIGDTVNLAARMEGSAAPWSINITEATHRQVAPYFELNDLGTLEVKGKSEPVHAYEVLREVGARSRLDASVLRGLTPYVGRREQLDLLRTHFEQARRGHGQVVFISGEAGIGKSRLLLEFRRTLGEEARWLEGHCISWGGTFPYLPVVDVVRSAVGADESDDDETLVRRVEQSVAGWDGAAAAAAIPQLLYLLNVDQSNAAGIEPSDRRMRIFGALTTLLVQESRRQPLVVCVEDLHWADEQSDLALSAMADAVASLPVLLIVTHRPGYQHALGNRSYHARISLGNLPPEASATMVQGVLQSTGVPAQLQQIIISKAEGNPFFIEEVSRSLIEAGVLRREDGAYQLARPVEQIAIPDTIQEVILSRIDRLQQRAKEVVQFASVIGRDFPVRLLKHIAQAEDGIDALLRDLKSLELIYEKSYFPELEYMFKHALTQEVALSTLLGERRKALHRTVAAAIRDVYADHLSEQHEALAHHYFQGEEWELACEYAKRVALRAEALYAPRAAIEQATRAIESAQRCDPACCDELMEPELFRIRGRAYEAVGDFDRAQLDYEAAIGAAQHRSDGTAEWQAHADLGMLWAGRDYEQTGEHFRRAYEVALAIKDEALAARSLNRLGNWKVNTGHVLEGIQHHEEALAHFRRLGDKRGIAESVDFLAMATALAGDFVSSWRYGDEGIELWRELDERQALANLLASSSFSGLNVETFAVVALPDTDNAYRDGAREALDIARSIGWRAGEAYALMHSALQAVNTGAFDDALRDGTAALDIAVEIGHEQWQVAAKAVLSSLYYELQDPEAALVHIEGALLSAREAGSAHWTECCSGLRALIAADLGSPALARETLARALAPDMPMISLGQRGIWLSKAALALAEGDCQEVTRVIEGLARTAKNTDERGLEVMPVLAWIRGRANLGLGALDAALTDLEAAIRGGTTHGARTLLWKAHAAVGDVRAAAGRADLARQSYDAACAIVDELAAGIADRTVRDAFLGAPAVARLREALSHA